MVQVDAHLTRDLTGHLWTSLDGAWYTGGQASVDGIEGEKLDNLGVGLTVGYQISENLGLTIATSRPSTTALRAISRWTAS